MRAIGALRRFIDDTNMYRLVLLYLSVVLGLAFLLGVAGRMPQDAGHLALALVLVTMVSEATNRIFARVWGIHANRESTLITALLIVLLMSPVAPDDHAGLIGLALAGVWAVASKYLLVVRGKHIFNPAALGVALVGQLLGQPPTWWAGSSAALVPVIALGGLAVMMKLRRNDIILAVVLANVLTLWAAGMQPTLILAAEEALLHTPLLFLTFTMLTEPLTRPHGRWQRLVFAAGVGVLSVPVLRIGQVYMTPEFAVLIGNAFAFLVSPRDRLVLRLLRVEDAARSVRDFLFAVDHPKGLRLAFRPGQYLEWTLGTRDPDQRGNRRYFTIASAPSDPEIRLGVKLYEGSSAFKRALNALRPGDLVHVAQLAGHFTLPRNPARKVALLAGGIGVTPYRSMLADLVARGEARPVTLLYANLSPAEIAYRALFDQAAALPGVQVHYALEEGADQVPGAHAGRIDAALIRTLVPDFAERLFYVSGPPSMVRALRRTLRAMGVRRWNIRTDFFPGLAA